ncbi:thymidine phosphorylase [Pontibacter mucosus]|uniref:thymidine phosphorylase n=1 Tax=Pontibacter mucosus TaxID=1649266 RepID=A0A2T5Y9N4_9BACT|nr:thymidine phosphorylase family protein [Pontibacter mucosus]PTX13111.1 thymidine phosphorylase [Pontibacter mucosus]
MEHNELKFRNLGIDTQQEHVAYMRSDCHVCKSEGFAALTRIRVSDHQKHIVASLNVIESELLSPGEISLSKGAWKALQVKDGDSVTVSHLTPVESMRYVRSKIYGNKLPAEAYHLIIQDIVQGNFSNVDIAAFVTGCAMKMSEEEVISLTEAMIEVGEKMVWGVPLVVDKHSVGGLPGNRTTPIVVSIIAACGLIIPKTSSRAITSPAGTADTLETITRVSLSSEEIKQVVSKEGGCFAWGGSVKLSPADDIIIRVERALDIDSEGQLIASVLSKKKSAGATHVVIDIPVGETAKVRDVEAGEKLRRQVEQVALAIGLQIKVLLSDGSQPVGRGIGPVLEALDVLAVLENEMTAPQDLKERALVLAGNLLELAGKVPDGKGVRVAQDIVESGEAYRKFKAICLAQGGFTRPELAPYHYEVKAEKAGTVQRVDNRRLAKVAKLAGAPDDPAAGVLFAAPLGKKVALDEVLYTIFAESEGELLYALEYVSNEKNIITII